jgi:hypothetical protein
VHGTLTPQKIADERTFLSEGYGVVRVVELPLWKDVCLSLDYVVCISGWLAVCRILFSRVIQFAKNA